MAQATGMHTIDSLLKVRFQSVAEFGLSTIERVLQDEIDAHNTIVNEMVEDMCELTTERQRIYGTGSDGEMNEVDEFGAAPTQESEGGATVAFPLRLFQFNLGWTQKWMETKTPADMAEQTQAAEKAHLREIQRQLKKAIYLSANYTIKDRLVDKVSLDVKRFVNADSANMPSGPNGETFDGATHTHYDANNGWDATAYLASINDVIEHGHGNRVVSAINKADETAVRALTGFVAYPDPRIIYRASDTPGQTLDISRLDNRAIGVFNGAEIWVKPWAIDNYPFTWDAGDPNKPLCFRQRTAESLQGLRIAAENGDYPLFAKFMEAEFGIGVWTRTNGAVLYVGAGTWADPTIA
jgi:hypothetical protein